MRSVQYDLLKSVYDIHKQELRDAIKGKLVEMSRLRFAHAGEGHARAAGLGDRPYCTNEWSDSLWDPLRVRTRRVDLLGEVYDGGMGNHPEVRAYNHCIEENGNADDECRFVVNLWLFAIIHALSMASGNYRERLLEMANELVLCELEGF